MMNHDNFFISYNNGTQMKIKDKEIILGVLSDKDIKEVKSIKEYLTSCDIEVDIVFSKLYKQNMSEDVFTIWINARNKKDFQIISEIFDAKSKSKDYYYLHYEKELSVEIMPSECNKLRAIRKLESFLPKGEKIKIIAAGDDINDLCIDSAENIFFLYRNREENGFKDPEDLINILHSERNDYI